MCHKELWPQLCAGSSALPTTRVWSIPVYAYKSLIAGCKKTEAEFVWNKLSVRCQATQNAKKTDKTEPTEGKTRQETFMSKSSEGSKQKEKSTELRF